MNIKNNLQPSIHILKSHVNRYTFLGLGISLASILLACLIVSYQLTGGISLHGIIQAQKTNPAIWILDLTPFMFGYWGQAFCQSLMAKAQNLIGDRTKELLHISGNLESKLKYASNYDSITNLPNSRMLSEQVTQAINQLGEENQLALIVIRINDFNNMIYRFGDFNANNILKQFAEKLKTILLDPYLLDASLGLNTAARLQGDGFALLFPRMRKNFTPDDVLSILVKLINKHFILDEINITIGTTLGMAIYPIHGDEEGILLNNANIAAYQAKNEGKPYLVYSKEMKVDLTQNRQIVNELKQSIEDSNLAIYYQPIIDLNNGNIVGVEALVRFEHPEYGLLSADKFIHLIEDTSLIHQLTTLMLKDTIKQLSEWHKEGHNFYASVNLSLQDVADSELPALIKKLLNDYGVASKYLKLDFTEKVYLTDQSITKVVFNNLSNLGVKLSINDFCSNYSFVYLINYPINDIKIEKAYVLNMIEDANNAKIVATIIKLAQILGFTPIAVGITDKATLDKLKELGCNYGQGFYFSRPVNSDEFKELLNNKEDLNKLT